MKKSFKGRTTLVNSTTSIIEETPYENKNYDNYCHEYNNSVIR